MRRENVFTLVVLARQRDKNGGAVGVIGDGCLRHGQVAQHRPRVDNCAGKHAGHQVFPGVGNAGFDRDVTRGRVEAGVYGADAPRECLVGEAVGGHRYFLADSNGFQLGLGHVEVDIDGVEGLQRGDFVTGVEVLPGVDSGNAYTPGKGRTNGFLRHQRPLLFCGGQFGFEVCVVGVHLRLGHGVDRQLCAVTLEDDGGQVRRGFQRMEQGDVRISIQLNQQRLCCHFLARCKTDAAHNAARFGGHIDPAHGFYRAHGGHRRLPVVERYLHGGDDGGGQGLLCLGNHG